MKKIRIKISNYNENEAYSYGRFLLAILRKHYDVELSDAPDYIFYNEASFEHLDHDCIRIFYTGENIHPDFNLCDYAFAFDYMDFGDRYFRLPIYLVATFYRDLELAQQGDSMDFTRQISLSPEDLAKKDGFCSFVYSNYLGDGTRKEFFDMLSRYRKVDAGGAYLNNVGGRVANKLEFEARHKFSIAFENSSNEGYTTEKLPNALSAGTVPIYWGNPNIGKEFNEGRFVNCHAFKDFDEAIERIKEIDSNDDLYLKMISEPVEAPGHDFRKVLADFEKFLLNIFDQPLEKARRRKINPVRAFEAERNGRIIARVFRLRASAKKAAALLYQPIKKLGFLEKAKQSYFASRISNIK